MFIKSLLNMLMIQVIIYLSGHPFNWITFNEKYFFTLRQVTKTILTSTFRDIFTCLMSTSSYWYYIHFTDKLFVRRCFPGVSEETSCGYSSFGFYSLFLYSMVTQYKCTLLCSTDIVQYVQCTFASSVCTNNKCHMHSKF